MSQDQVFDSEFVRQLTAYQPRLRAYIWTLFPDPHAADEIVQNANVVLWSKRNEFALGTEFGAWACRIAYYEVLSHRREIRRERHLFSEELLARVAATAASRVASIDQRANYLRQCLGELPAAQRRMILQRYQPGESVKGIAATRGSSPGAIAKSLARIRLILMKCVERKMGTEASR